MSCSITSGGSHVLHVVHKLESIPIRHCTSVLYFSAEMCLLLFAWRGPVLPYRGPAYPSDPPFPSFAATEDGDSVAEEEIWCPQGEEDPLEVIYEE